MKFKLSSIALLTFGMLPALAMASHWGYEGKESPEHWGELSKENQLCQKGMNQSPVDIHATLQAHLEPLKNNYPDSPVSILNNGHTIQANAAEDTKDTITLDNTTTYKLQQLHFHAPSENTINGKHYAMEMHLVHKNSDNELAVVAVMFDIGAENEELNKLWLDMPKKSDYSAPLRQKIDLEKLLPMDKTHYMLSGSLTTPPCTEGVRWLIMKHPITLSETQLKQFTSVMHHSNNRPIQPLHGRLIVE